LVPKTSALTCPKYQKTSEGDVLLLSIKRQFKTHKQKRQPEDWRFIGFLAKADTDCGLVTTVCDADCQKSRFLSSLKRANGDQRAMAIRLINEARLRTIRSRQWGDRWGVDYVASIWATAQEAPGWSFASILHPRKLGGRDFHTLSRPETFAALLALHNDRLWDLHEHRVLFPEPRAHFLFGHPRAAGISLSPIAGTIDVASRLDILSRHPKVYVRTGGAMQPPIVVPFPFIGDLLLYLEDEAGAYVLNWTVTDKLSDFRGRGRRPITRRRPTDDDLSESDRQLIERIYYEDAGIRTQKITGAGIDFDLRCNLRDLFLEQLETVNLPFELIAEITAMFRAAVGSGEVGYEVARDVAAKFSITDRVAVTVLKQGIWNREIRLDLFRPILMDRPLHPEVCDVFDHYREWFRR
jgi:hypothetical protein